MPISSASSNEWPKVLPPMSVKTDLSSKQNSTPEQNSAPSQEMLQLSKKAQLISQQLQSQPKDKQDDAPQGNESIQVSSSIGRTTMATGLSRNEAIAIYRSIESMMK